MTVNTANLVVYSDLGAASGVTKAGKMAPFFL
jgi:hypothetical protein